VERLEISILKEKGYMQKDIAKSLGVNKSTISRELKRNSYVPEGKGSPPTGKKKYDPQKASDKARKRRRYARTGIRKIIINPKMREFIENSLKHYKWSPEQISGRWKYEFPKEEQISFVTIYKFLDSVEGEKFRKYLYLEMKGKKKKKNKAGKKELIPNRKNIEYRPEDINNRKYIGDAEGDLIVSKQGEKSAMVTVIDRKSRFLFAEKIPDKKPSSVLKKIKKIQKSYTMNSITLDNGLEFMYHEQYGCDTYFCNPYRSSEKGQIEYANRLIRQFIPKKSIISDFSDKRIQEIVRLINNTPKKCLGYKTPIEVRFSKNVRYSALNPRILGIKNEA
jgi:IS30 family transposase